MTLYEQLRQRKAHIKARLEFINALNREKANLLNYKRIGLK